MHTYKVWFRKLVNGAWGAESARVVYAENIVNARAMVLTKDVIIERILRL